MHQFGWLSERGCHFLNLLQKDRGTQKGVGGSLRKGGGSNPGENYGLTFIILMWTQHRINTEKLYLISKEKKQHGHRRRRYFSYLYKFNWYGLCIYQISDGLYLFYTKLLQVKKSYTEYSFAENDKYKLLKWNRLLANALPSYFFIFKLIYLLTKWFKK